LIDWDINVYGKEVVLDAFDSIWAALSDISVEVICMDMIGGLNRQRYRPMTTRDFSPLTVEVKTMQSKTLGVEFCADGLSLRELTQ